MIGYAARTIPWPRVTAAACLALVLMEMVGRWPYSAWALLGGSMGLLAGGAAWCLDEPAARLVDTLPRSLAWRTAARLPVVAVMALVWAVALTRSWDSLGGHGWVLTVQGLVAVAVALAWTTWRRSGGVATPGTAFAVGLVPVALVWGMTPVAKWVPVLPYVAAPGEDWAASARGWALVGAVALCVLAAALADARWWHLRRQPEVPVAVEPQAVVQRTR